MIPEKNNVAVSDGTVTICFNRCVFVPPSIQPLMRHALILLLVYHVTSHLYTKCHEYSDTQFWQKNTYQFAMMPKPILFAFKYYPFSCVAMATTGTIICTPLIWSRQGPQILILREVRN